MDFNYPGFVRDHIKFLRQTECGMEPTCLTYGDEGSFEKLMVAQNESQKCLGVLKNYKLFVTPSSVYHNKLRSCTTGFRNAFRNCLNDEAKYFPEYVLELYQSILEFWYRNHDKILENNGSDPEIAQCLSDLGRGTFEQQLRECTNKTLTNFSSGTDWKLILTVPPKSQYCRDTAEIFTCASNLAKRTCIKDIKVTRLIDDFFASIQAPCLRNKTTAA